MQQIGKPRKLGAIVLTVVVEVYLLLKIVVRDILDRPLLASPGISVQWHIGRTTTLETAPGLRAPA